MTPDIEAAAEFLRRWGLPIQLTSIDPRTRKIETRFFSDVDPALVWCRSENDAGRNLYFTVNGIGSSHMKKPGRRDVAEFVSAHVDLDAAAGESVDAAKQRHLAALRQFRPLPTVVIDSGGGVQAFWRLDSPVAVNGSAIEYEAINIAIARQLGGDHCHNIDRIMRLPGTVNWPDEKKIAKGREPALAKLLCFDDARRYAIGDLPRAVAQPVPEIGGLPEIADLEAVPELAGNEWLLDLIATGDDAGTPYKSRSEAVFAAVCCMIRAGVDDATIAAIVCDPRWAISTHVRENPRGARAYAAKLIADAHAKTETVGNVDAVGTPDPDMSVLSEGRRPAPELPCGDDEPFLAWAAWIRDAAESKGAPTGYVAMALLVAAGAVIGTSRWARAWDGWDEPPILFAGLVGLPSTGKSPAFDPIKAALDEIEAEMAVDYPDTLRAWERDVEAAKAAKSLWQADVKTAIGQGMAAPDMPVAAVEPEMPPRPRIVVNDSTPEELAHILSASPRGLLLYRDELSGWLHGFDRYSDGGERQFWTEAFGGRRYAVDRVKFRGKPLVVQHLAVAVAGGIQPDCLHSVLVDGDDDGLSARFLLTWPDPVPPKRPRAFARQNDLTAAFRRFRELPVPAGNYVAVPLDETAAGLFQSWREADHRAALDRAAGRFLGHVGKLPALALRLALILEFLWWVRQPGQPEPAAISADAVTAALCLIEDYFMPMAARCYGDAAIPEPERHAAAVARWIRKSKPAAINARQLRREYRSEIPGLPNDAAKIGLALKVLVEAGWLTRIVQDRAHSRREDYEINPLVLP